jgi:NADPH:quinone reductase-like Zn-dependent oxidoreductase
VALQQQPVLLGGFAGLAFAALGHAHECKASLEPLAGEVEVELAVAQALVDVASRHPMPAVPDHDAAGAVLALGNLALEPSVVERVVLGLHGEAPVLRAQARLLRDGPALEHAVVLETKVVVQPRRVVALHDEL